MAELSNEQVVRRYVAAHEAHDYDTVGALRHPDWTTEWPQSRERIRGHANDRAIMDNWPGGFPDTQTVTIVGSEDKFVLTPAYTVQRVAGSGDTWWIDGSAGYPDGSTWFFAAMIELGDGKIHAERWYFAPELEAPAWRAAWVERMD